MVMMTTAIRQAPDDACPALQMDDDSDTELEFHAVQSSYRTYADMLVTQCCDDIPDLESMCSASGSLEFANTPDRLLSDAVLG
eukprot:7690589-Karenia_brevis.AAC.1